MGGDTITEVKAKINQQNIRLPAVLPRAATERPPQPGEVRHRREFGAARADRPLSINLERRAA